MQKIKKYLWIIIEDSLPVLTIIFTIYLIYKNSISPLDEQTLLIWILAILALLAGGELVQRYTKLTRIEHMLIDIDNTTKSASIQPSVDRFLKNRRDFAPFEQRIEQANEICILAASFIGIATTYSGLFTRKIKEGCKFKFLLIKPETDSATIMSKALYTIKGPSDFNSDIKRTLQKLRSIVEISKNSNIKGTIEIKLMEWVPSYSMVLINPNKPNGEIIVELYSFLEDFFDRPHFELTAKDHKWYEFFYCQFNTIWDKAEPYIVNQNST